VKPPREGVPSWEGRKLQVWTRTTPPRFVGSVAVDPAAARDWRGRAARGVGDLVRRAELRSTPLALVPFPPVRRLRALRNASGAWSSVWWLPFPASWITDPNSDAWRPALLRDQRKRRAADRQSLDRLRSAVQHELRGPARSLRDLRRLLRTPEHEPGFIARLLSKPSLTALLEQLVVDGVVEHDESADRWRGVVRKPTPATPGLVRDGDAR
jgi:signal transduction histidine kinase